MTAALAHILPPAHLHPPEEGSPWALIDGHRPELVAHPRDGEETARVVTACSRGGWPLVPSGRGHALERGGALTAARVVLHLDRLSGVTHFNPADLVISAQAGTPLPDLKREAATVGLHLALDPSGGEEASLGGVVALGLAGAERGARGRVRDQLLGLEGVLGDGTPFAAGGKVVKNVAGYDLCRLFTGSRGALGVITGATLKLMPRPRAEAAWGWGEELEMTGALAAAADLGTPRLDPLVLGLWGRPGRCRLGLVLAGEEEDLASRRQLLPAGLVSSTRSELRKAENMPWQQRGEGEALVRLAVVPSALGRTLAGLPEAACFFVDLLAGRADITLPAEALPDLAARAREGGGWCRVEEGPPGLRRVGEGGGGEGGAAAALAAALRKAFDPRGIMVPGRMA